MTAVDGEGQPIASPTLALHDENGPQVEVVKAGTGDAVAFGPVGPGNYVLTGKAEGFKPINLPVRIMAGESNFELVMQRGTTISGRVLDLYGRGASDIPVLVQPSGELARADAEGRFSVLVPSPGEYTLQAHHSNWGGVEQKVSAPAEGVELSLEPGASMRVVVQAGGRRLEGASVRVSADLAGTFNSGSLSGPDGVVWMRGLPPGTFELVVKHPDYLSSEPVETTVHEGQEVTVEVSLNEGATIDGVVVDTDGAPISDVTVVPSQAAQVKSDANGHFTIKGIVPGQSVELNAHHPDYDKTDYDKTARTQVQVEAGMVAMAKLVMKRRGRYRGRVVTGDGKPLSRFRVDLLDFTDPTGHFELPLPLETYRTMDGPTVRLSIDAQGYLSEVVDHPADRLDLGTIELKPAPSFNGRVVDDNGDGVAGAVVSCLDCEKRVLTEADGSFALEFPGVGRRVTLTAGKGALSAQKELNVNEDHSELVLRSLARLSGTYYDSAGRPQGGVKLAVSTSSESNGGIVVTGADGRYRYDGSPGPIRIAAVPRGVTEPTVVQIARLEEGGSQLDLGRVPGTAQLTVKVSHAGDRYDNYRWILALVPGDFDPQAVLFPKVMAASWAQVEGIAGPSGGRGGNTVHFRGLTAGRYTVVYGLPYARTKDDEIVRRIDVRGDQTLSIEVPAARPK